MDPFPEGMVEDVKKFFQHTHPYLEVGQDIYPEVFNTTFFPLQRQEELIAMMRRAKRVNTYACPECQDGCNHCGGRGWFGGPKTVMEIGADKGGSLYHWVMCLPTVETVIACEIRGIPYMEIFDEAFPHHSFFWISKSSRDSREVATLRQSLQWENLKIDCLFIDGDKGAFLQDFDTYLPLMNPQGVIFLHDIQDSPGPKEAFETIRQRGYRTESVILTGDSKRALFRQEQGLPPANAHEGWLRHWQGRSCGVGVIWL